MILSDSFKQKLFLFLFLFILFSPDIFADTIPGVPIYVQTKSHWCWAGASEIILKYWNPDMTKTQTQIASVVTTENKAAKEEEIAECVSENGKPFNLECTMIPKTLSWSDMKKEADTNQPFIFFIRWNSGAYHCEVFAGYVNDSTKLKFIDPNHGGKITYRSYTNCFNVSCGSNRGKWERTYVTSLATPIEKNAVSPLQNSSTFNIIYDKTPHRSSNWVIFSLNGYSKYPRTLQIYNARGNSVFSVKIERNTSLVPWNNSLVFPSGMYYVTLTESTGQSVQSSKIQVLNFVK